jgi:AcrR family transcriptional regulator
MDPRRQRSIAAVQRVFFSMVLSRRYHEITIQDILLGAGIAKSTFYEIYPNKDALLASALEGPFAILARCVDEKPDVARTQALLAHFWENRGMARGLFTGSARPKLVAALATQVDARLAETKARLSISRPLAAAALAELMLGAISTWTLGRAPGDAGSLARALHQAGRTAFR